MVTWCSFDGVVLLCEVCVPSMKIKMIAVAI